MKLHDISTPLTGLLRPVTLKDNFPHVASTYEVFTCDDETGSFIQIAGPIQNRMDAENALGAFTKHPEFKGKKVFLVQCNRLPLSANFNPNLIKSSIVDTHNNLNGIQRHKLERDK